MKKLLFLIFFIPHLIVAQDFEIEFINSSDLLTKFANAVVKITVEGDNISKVDDIFVSKNETLTSYLYLEDFIEDEEEDLKEIVDELSAGSKDSEEREDFLENFPANLKKLEKTIKDVVKKIEKEIQTKEKLKEVLVKREKRVVTTVIYPKFSYDHIVKEQKKIHNKIKKKNGNGGEDEDETRKRHEELIKKFNKEFAPKIKKSVKKIQKSIDKCLDADEIFDDLEDLFGSLETYLSKKRLSNTAFYEDFEEEFNDSLKETKNFGKLIKHLIRRVNSLMNIVAKENEFYLHPKDRNKFEDIKSSLEKEIKDYKKMIKETQEIHSYFKSNSKVGRWFKGLRNKKKIKKFLKSVKDSKKAIGRLELEKLIQELQKTIKSIRFIPK